MIVLRAENLWAIAIRGVHNGSVAVNSIQAQFFVLFLRPDADGTSNPFATFADIPVRGRPDTMICVGRPAATAAGRPGIAPPPPSGSGPCRAESELGGQHCRIRHN
jgi:hypothetical protein